MLRPRLLPALGLAVLALPASAHAADHCVSPAASCDQATTYADLQAALDGAAAAPGADRVVLPAGTFTAPTATGFAYQHAGKPVELVGAGKDQTIITGPAGATRVLRVNAGGQPVKLGDLQIAIPDNAGNSAVGLEVQGDLERVAITRGATQAGAVTAMWHFGGDVRDSVVQFPATGANDTGVVYNGVASTGTISGSTVEVRSAISVGQGNTVTIERSRVKAAASGIGTYGGTIAVRNTLVHVTGNGAGLYANTQNARDAAIHADHVTLVGATGNAIVASNSLGSGNEHSAVSLRNAVIRGFSRALLRSGTGGGSATITAAWSDYDATGSRRQESGPGQITEANVSNVGDAGFVAADDFRLAAGSKLVDAAEPVASTVGDQDLAGSDRTRDGDGDCTPRRDLGAYELQADPPASCFAQPGAPATDGQPVTAGTPAPDAGAPGTAPAPAAVSAPATTSTRAALTRDLLAPRIGKPVVKRLAGGRVRVRFALGEAATVTVKVGRATRRLRAKAGTVTALVRTRGGRVSIVAVDTAGNRAQRRGARLAMR